MKDKIFIKYNNLSQSISSKTEASLNYDVFNCICVNSFSIKNMLNGFVYMFIIKKNNKSSSVNNFEDNFLIDIQGRNIIDYLHS